MSVSLTEKITVAEAHEWLKNASMEWGLTHHEADEFVENVTGFRPRDFKAPKAKRGPNKNSLSLEDRLCLPYDPTRCDAGVYVGPGGKPGPGGHWVQCKCKADGVCKTHQKVVDKHGVPRDGYFNQERPTHPFNDETKPPTPWEGVDVPKRKKGKKSSDGDRKPTTCGHCGEVGHNKRTCPNLNQEAKKPVKKPKKSMEDEKAELLKKLAALEKKQEAAVVVNTDETTDHVEESVEETTSVEEVSEEASMTESEVAAAGCWPSDHSSEPEPEPEPESEVLQADTSEYQVDLEEDLTTEELEEDSDTITVDDESDETIECSFEGIEYVRDKSGTVFDMPEMDAVGTWDEDSQSISFEKHALKAHKKMRDPEYN